MTERYKKRVAKRAKSLRCMAACTEFNAVALRLINKAEMLENSIR